MLIIDFTLKLIINKKRRFELVIIILNIELCLLISLTLRQRFKFILIKS